MTYLPQVDEIIMLENGRIVEMGTYDELMQLNGLFYNFVGNYNDESSIDDDDNFDDHDTLDSGSDSSSDDKDRSKKPKK